MEGNPTDVGNEVLAQLESWIYRPRSTGKTLLNSLLCGTYEQAQLAMRLCVAALVDTVSPQNCFSLLALADSCACTRLYCAAGQCALANFTKAIHEDAAGFGRLNEEQMQRILTSDVLVVQSEYDVFLGLSTWIEYDLQDRQGTFARNLALCIRWKHMTMADIERCDQTELLGQDKEAICLLANAVIQFHMGWEDDNQWMELSTNPNPRGAQLPPSPPPMLAAVLQASMGEIAPPSDAQLVDVMSQERVEPATKSPTSTAAKKLRPSSAVPEDPITSAARIAQDRVLSPSSMQNVPLTTTQIAGELPTRRALF